ncbi:DUF892 family protein [Haoranjiania flava]|uniref:DUF892 family protein n=1 Tax=Haoranjiania flava TaxID=1856322 RepID=A0AAE3LJS0_9BACT|nr:DUF892 family protein [Haoranjiania flava]MCU7693868.1 DUF892 family protein [Haoranjiania flava]
MKNISRQKKLAHMFHHTLSELYFIEKSYNDLIKKLNDYPHKQLRKYYSSYLAARPDSISAIEVIFLSLNKKVKTHKTEKAKHLIKNTRKLMSDAPKTMYAQFMFTHAIHKVKHYQIAIYKVLITWTDMLGYTDAKSILLMLLNSKTAAVNALDKHIYTLLSAHSGRL